MESCTGNCAGCSGCARELVLTREEIGFLRYLGQIPFLPVARTAADPAPVCLEEGEPEKLSLVLQCLEKKGLISLDYDKPLTGTDPAVYRDYPIRGSMALTRRGQLVLEMLEYQGAQTE